MTPNTQLATTVPYDNGEAYNDKVNILKPTMMISKK